MGDYSTHIGSCSSNNWIAEVKTEISTHLIKPEAENNVFGNLLLGGHMRVNRIAWIAFKELTFLKDNSVIS